MTPHRFGKHYTDLKGEQAGMATLDSSSRSTLQATYTPIGLPPSVHGKASQNGRALEKYAFLAALSPKQHEVDELGMRVDSTNAAAPSWVTELKAAEMAVPSLERQLPLIGARHLHGADPDALLAIGEDLVRLRQQRLEEVLIARKQLARSLASPSPVTSAHAPVAQKSEATSGQSPRAIALSTDLPLSTLTGKPPAGLPTSADLNGSVSDGGAVQPDHGASLEILAEIAGKRGLPVDTAMHAVELVRHIVPDIASLSAGELRATVACYLPGQLSILDGFRAHFAVEPIGFLHLERLVFTPVGIERGELLHAVPLAPGEEVNLTHREWSNTQQEFSNIVTDFLERFSEEGVTEKSELAQAASSQEQHSSGLNTGVTASAGWGGVNITTSISSNVAEAASSSQQTTRNHSSDVTRKASTRVKQEHKVSFRVASAAGTEDQAVRRFKNPHDDRAARIDYYQMLRRWRVDLHRYGVRLTYDITVPEPGSDIIARLREIDDIKAALEFEFGPSSPGAACPPPDGKPSWATFDLTPDCIDRTNYLQYAAQYSVEIKDELIAPEDRRVLFPDAATQTFEEEDQIHQKPRLFNSPEADTGNDYIVDHASLHDLLIYPHYGAPSYWIEHIDGATVGSDQLTPDQFEQQMRDLVARSVSGIDIPQLRGRSGKITLGYLIRDIWAIRFEVHLEVSLTDDAYSRWQLRVWRAIRTAAQALYNQHREILTERLGRLINELGAQDPLSLRKTEREEIMKGVLRWLIGPRLTFGPPGGDTLYDPTTQAIVPSAWSAMLSYGELIKYLHNAIEWENLLYFLYPYFWSSISTWELRKYLDHPDPMHRAFLKSGAARVVLTVRPGFERSFTALLALGKFGEALGAGGLDHPYITIAQEMENYARTNYPGIPPANPELNARPLLTPRQQQAWEELQVLVRLLDAYFGAHGRYPATDQGLTALERYAAVLVPLTDPWDRPYVYVSPGVHGPYDLATYGANGSPDDSSEAGEDRDITSWGVPSPESLTARQVRALRDIRALVQLLDAYMAGRGRYPTSAQGLTALAPYAPLLVPRRDPWGDNYAYRCPGEHADYDLLSFGGDTTSDRAEVSKHITSWAEASLIGTWYEYTPTSAMDLLVAEPSPGPTELPQSDGGNR